LLPSSPSGTAAAPDAQSEADPGERRP